MMLKIKLSHHRMHLKKINIDFFQKYLKLISTLKFERLHIL